MRKLKEIYYFDKKNLTYKKINSRKRTIINYISIILSSLTLLFIFYIAIIDYSPVENQNNKIENRFLLKENQKLNNIIIKKDNETNITDSLFIKELNNILKANKDSLFIPPNNIKIKYFGTGGINRYNNKFNQQLINSIKKTDSLEILNNIEYNYRIYLLDTIKQYVNYYNSKPSILPVNKETLIDNYISPIGDRFHPILHKIKFHSGIDIHGKLNSDVYSSGNGIIEKTVHNHSGYGNYIVINHGFGFKTLYAHLNKINVVKNQKINRGDVIGLIGSTGRSTGEHLHYEIYYKDSIVNPLKYISNFEYKTTKTTYGGN